MTRPLGMARAVHARCDGIRGRRDVERDPANSIPPGERAQARRGAPPSDHRGRLQRNAVPHGPRGHPPGDGPGRRRGGREGLRRPEEYDVLEGIHAGLRGGSFRRTVQDREPERETLVFVRAELRDLTGAVSGTVTGERDASNPCATTWARSRMLICMFRSRAIPSRCISACGHVVTRVVAPESTAAWSRREATPAACPPDTSGKPAPAPGPRAASRAGDIWRTFRSLMNLRACRGGS